MITSSANVKLKLIRKLAERKHRAELGLFVTEGEDLLAAGLAAGREPRHILTTAGEPLRGFEGSRDLAGISEEVDPTLLREVSSLGSGARVIAVWPVAEEFEPREPCLYLEGVSDPRNVGAIIRSAHALAGGSVALGPDCADVYSPVAVRATMGSLFGQPVGKLGLGSTPEPRVGLVAHGGEGLDGLAGAATLCLGSERDGLPDGTLAACERTVTIPLRPGGAESLNVAAAAAIACQWISSPTGP